MAVVAGDIKAKLSGGASNNQPNLSLGGVRSSVDMSGTALNNLFDNVSAGEATSGRVEYRCVYITNTNNTDTIGTVVVFMGGLTPSPTSTLDIGLDPAGVGDGAATGVAATVSSETEAPAGVTFSSPVTEGAGLAVGTLGPGQGIALWCRRTITAGAGAATGDGTSLEFRGTPA